MTTKTTGRPDSRDPRSVWSVRGVPHEARVAANKAAELADIGVGEWLGRLIQEHAGEEIKAGRALGKTVEDMAADLAEQMRQQTSVIQGMTTRLEALEQERRRGFLERLFARSKEQRGPVNQSIPTPHS